MIVAALVLFALLAGMTGTSLALMRAQVAEGLARHSLAEVEEEQQRTNEEAEKSKTILSFIEEKVFAAARPEGLDGGLGHEVLLTEALEAALPSVRERFSKQPLIEAHLRMTLGSSFGSLDRSKIAAEQYQRARTLLSENLGLDHPTPLSA